MHNQPIAPFGNWRSRESYRCTRALPLSRFRCCFVVAQGCGYCFKIRIRHGRLRNHFFEICRIEARKVFIGAFDVETLCRGEILCIAYNDVDDCF
jgi:hypothetical protein